MADTPGDAATLNDDKRSRISDSPRYEDTNGISVSRAEEEFNALSRQLTARSELGNGFEKSVSTVDVKQKDIEKGDEEKDRFDLRDYLSSSNDAHQSAGIKHKHVGITWEDLQVEVVGGADSKIYVGTFGGAIVNFFLAPILFIWGLIAQFLPNKQIVTRPILHKSSGVLKPGEMCLVLGCPGSGCTTFLKAIANQREGYAKVSGNVLYAGMEAEEMAKYYKGEVVYNEEDDRHIATLTVAQTLEFALSTKTPGPNGRLPGVSRKEFNDEVLDTLLKMLNISHTRETLVGDAFVRGVSGGERKRVSIAEMMTTRARVQSWDNSTRGLDASTALDFAKSLRIMTDILGQTTFVSLYQAGEGIYDLFDKVLVLDQGRQVYFGPPKDARAYFENLGYKSLPRQSTPDYLTGCTDPNERQFAPGLSVRDVPSSPEALESAFLSSPYGSEVHASLEKYKIQTATEKTDQEAFRAAVIDDKKKGVSKKSPYTLGLSGQILALARREFQKKTQDRFQLYTSFSISTTLALIIGGAYYGQPLTAAGAFTRGGVIFAALLTTCLEAFGEMPMQMANRPILKKQTGFSMYRPAAVALGNTLADLPFSATRILLFNIIVYFMTNLNRSAGGFFTFHLFNYVAYLAMQGFFRTFGLLCQDFNVAFRIATFFIPNFIEYAGYMLPVDSMKRWLFWIYYINPIAYAWQGIMENEFSRIEMVCNGAYVLPRNGPGVDKYPTVLGEFQVCTIYGAASGSDIVTGEAYLDAAFSLDTADMWRRCLVILLSFLVLFQLSQIVALEVFPQYGRNAGISVFTKEDDETKKLNATLKERKIAHAKENEEAKARAIENTPRAPSDAENAIAKEQAAASFAHKKSFTWENLHYTVPVPGGTRVLLNDVFGYVKPGTLTALMGASGAGKTTCLDVLAQRKNIGVISGDVLVDGRPLTSDFARGTAYAEQMDVHEGTATVREAMRFSAYLRQPWETPISEKDAYVEEIIELLELQDMTEALVATLNVETRKRLTIGVELASKPELLLFLDEPTSGLDAQSAWNLVRFLRKLADQGQAILCTIHQPSSLLFESFDRLLLLQRGGNTVYFGDIGSDSHVLRDYFARHGAVCPPNVNPAEYMLEAIGAGVNPRVGDKDWQDVWLESPECQVVRREIEAIKATGLATPIEDRQGHSAFATPFFHQLKVVVQRNNISLWRQPDYIFSRLFVAAFISLFVSLSFLQLGNSVRALQFRIFSIFWVTVLPSIIMSQIEPMFIENRRIFVRESSSRMYSPYVFAIGQLIGEIPYNVMCAIAYWALMVFPIGFGNGSAGTNGTGFQLLVTLFFFMFGVSLGQLIAAISPSIQVAVLFNPFLGLVPGTFCGVTIPYPTMISFWRSWLYYLDPYTWAISAMVSTELHGLTIECKPDEISVFKAPPGETCGSWANEFIDYAGGYLEDPNATDTCRYCQYSVGDEFYTPLNMDYSDRWRNAFILFAFFVFNVGATIIASRFLRYAKR